LRVRGFRFYFCSRQESRPQVHVQHAEGEAKFWIEPAVQLHANYGLKATLVVEAEKLVEEHGMKSAAPERSTSHVEVTNVSAHGFWILIEDQEPFAPFKEFPWFKDASIREITRVELPSPHYLCWPDSDIDLAVDSLTHQERYPLVSLAQPNRRLQPGKAQHRSRAKRANRVAPSRLKRKR
jgi:hypothetical protein